MNSIGISTFATSAPFAWAQKNEVQMKAHSAWQGDISELSSEKLLKGQPSFTYLLRQGENEHYCISFVKPGGSIEHYGFILEVNQKGYYFRNGVTSGPKEVINDLISVVMHCNPDECIPLIRTTL
jgi:hypothetical protein